MAIYIGDKNITEVAAGNALDSAKQYADQGDAKTLQQAKEYTDSEVSQFEADYKQADATVLSEAKQYADQNMIPKSQKGQSGGLAELDETGRVPSSQLPSYVDDVIDVDTYSNLPNPGESGKIYITTDNNKQYRWSGTGYAEISSSLALGETSSTAYRGDRGKVAYDHSQIKSGNPHGTTFASLPDKPTSLPANGGNADTVDNLHASSFARASEFASGTDLNSIDGFGLFPTYTNSTATSERHYPISESGVLIYGNAAYGSSCQIYGSYNSNRWFVRGGGTGPSQRTPWAEIWTTKNLTKLSQLQDDVVDGNYFKLSANRITNLNDTPINSFFVSSNNPANSPASYTTYAVGLTLALNNDKNFKQQLIYTADNWYYRSQGGGDWYQWHVLWSAANFNPDDKLGVNAAAAAIKDTSDNSSKKIWTGTQAEYDAISTKDSNTIYFIV